MCFPFSDIFWYLLAVFTSESLLFRLPCALFLLRASFFFGWKEHEGALCKCHEILHQHAPITREVISFIVDLVEFLKCFARIPSWARACKICMQTHHTLNKQKHTPIYIYIHYIEIICQILGVFANLCSPFAFAKFEENLHIGAKVLHSW